VLPLGLFAAPIVCWYVAKIGALLLVLAVELLNTAIEKLADHITREQHPEIGVIKDFGSGRCFACCAWQAHLARGVRRPLRADLRRARPAIRRLAGALSERQPPP
jgi:diacylglycerol kinase